MDKVQKHDFSKSSRLHHRQNPLKLVASVTNIRCVNLHLRLRKDMTGRRSVRTLSLLFKKVYDLACKCFNLILHFNRGHDWAYKCLKLILHFKKGYDWTYKSLNLILYFKKGYDSELAVTF
jgi:hypothetical protein